MKNSTCYIIPLIVVAIVFSVLFIYFNPSGVSTHNNTSLNSHSIPAYTIKTLTGYIACDRISHLMLAIGKKRNKGITIYTLFDAERKLPKNDIYIANILTKYAYAHPEFNPNELRLRSLQECDRIVFRSTHIRIPRDVII